MLCKMTDNSNFDELKVPYDPVLYKAHRYSDIVPCKKNIFYL